MIDVSTGETDTTIYSGSCFVNVAIMKNFKENLLFFKEGNCMSSFLNFVSRALWSHRQVYQVGIKKLA